MGRTIEREREDRPKREREGRPKRKEYPLDIESIRLKYDKMDQKFSTNRDLSRFEMTYL